MGITNIIENAVWLVLIGLCVKYVQFDEELNPKDMSHIVKNTRELHPSNSTLLNDTGELAQVGWHPYPVMTINEDKLANVFMGFSPLTPYRYKQFEYHMVSSGPHVLFFALANIKYAGSVFMGYYNYDTNEMVEDTDLTLPWEMIPMDTNAAMTYKRNIDYTKGGLRLSYKDTTFPDQKKTVREYQVSSEKLGISGSWKFEMGIQEWDTKWPALQGHLQVEPIDDTQRYWHLGYKMYGLELTGNLKIADKNIALGKSNKSLGMFDVGAGVFQYKTHWVWIAANFVLEDGRRMAFNFGGGISKTDKAQSNEDYVIINGHTVIMEPVVITYNPENLKENWFLKTDADIYNKYAVPEGAFTERTLDLKFTHTKSFDDSKNLGLVKSKLVQNFGTFSGWVRDDTGEKYVLEDVRGLCEFHYIQW
jgi:hypothetical protein